MNDRFLPTSFTITRSPISLLKYIYVNGLPPLKTNKPLFFSQVVALMGAHSFGGADYFNSGYKGKWTGIRYKGLSEKFFAVMLNSTLKYVNTVSK